MDQQIMQTGDAGVESASAGTACQTTSSPFAYVLTAVVLGIVVLLACALVTIGYAAAGALADATQRGEATWGYESRRDYAGDLDDLLEEMLDGYGQDGYGTYGGQGWN